MPRVALIGTCDTKLDELLFLRNAIRSSNSAIEIILIDVGRAPIEHEAISVTQKQLLKEHGEDRKVDDLPRGEVIKLMADCATKRVKRFHDQESIHGIISAGGSGGTSLASVVMREALPIGFPKLIVSTVASGDTGPIVQETDITLMYSVVDVAGLNQLLRNVLSNAGAAIAGMASSYASRTTSQPSSSKKRVGITMFGVTTPAVDTIRAHLESNYDIETYVFHATGHGGKAMERLIREGGLDAVLDLTTTEICDHITGGVMSAGPTRLDAALEAGIPNIISVGATDMTNFGPRATVPEKYQKRLLYEHNPTVTLMRTSREEARAVGEFIAQKIQKSRVDGRRVTSQVWLPTGGVSMISVPGGPFSDPDADHELFAAIREGLTETAVRIVEDKREINDPAFARDIAEALVEELGILGG